MFDNPHIPELDLGILTEGSSFSQSRLLRGEYTNMVRIRGTNEVWQTFLTLFYFYSVHVGWANWNCRIMS